MGPMPGEDPESPATFETALDRLEEIVRRLEDGDMPLEEALEVFEEGVRLSRFCHGKLRDAERRVEILLRDESGAIEPQRFDEAPVQDQE